MLNQVVLCGRLTSNVEVTKNEEGKSKAIVTIACPRSYKNEDGVYDTDFIKCILWNGIAENTAEYCSTGDIVGVKGRLKSTTTPSGEYQLQVIAEKISFLSSNKSED